MPQTPSRKKPELLAPAGSLEAFFAALDCGADAVYCGLQEFSARARAKNFDLAELERMSLYAHRQRRRLYLTINTLLKEKELPRLIEILSSLAAIGVDGIIVQDLGVWRLARGFFPEIPLHASTQMTIHNAAGVRVLEKLGFSRAVLARELSLAEIAAIRSRTSIELEHFVHGALCFSISGQCLFSSYLTGMSGNRGRCLQPCRRRYHHQNQAGYYFSPSDLAALELLPALIDAGVMSFKLEGRMKSAEYVARVVSAYRLVLDAPANGRKEAMKAAAEQLALSFGRHATRGFLSGSPPADLLVPSRSGGIGRPLGEIRSLAGGRLGFVTAERLHLGDRLRVQPKNDQAGEGFAVRELLVGEKKQKLARPGDFVRVTPPGRGMPFRVGDRVFKVGGKPLFTQDDLACRARLAAVSLPSARSEPKGTDFDTARQQALGDLLPEEKPTLADRLRLTVRGMGERDLALLDEGLADRLELPLDLKTMTRLGKRGGIEPGWAAEHRLIWEIPPILFGEDWEQYRRAVRILAGQGFMLFRLNNLGHLPLFAGLDGLTLLAGFRCPVMNSQAALAFRNLGISELCAGIEDERENLSEIFSRRLPLPLAVTVYGPVPLLLSRVPLKSLRPGSLLRSDRNEDLLVSIEGGLTEIRAAKDFSLTGFLHELKAMGCERIIADLRHCGGVSARGREVLAALAADRPLPGTSSFNYCRGLN